jgi:folate-binding protein YgfZ
VPRTRTTGAVETTSAAASTPASAEGPRTGEGAAASAGTPEQDREYGSLTEGCALVDRSERGRLALTGADAVEFLSGQITNEVAGLRPGEGCYAAFLTPKGKMLGDLRVLAAGEENSSPGPELLLDTERVALQRLFDTLRRFKVGYVVEVHKRTLETALLSLIGPRARAVAERAAAGAPPPETEHAHLPARIAGRAVRLIATAEPSGVEVLCAQADRSAVEQELLRAGAERAGEAAAEIVRVEHGRPRYGVDVDDTVIPQEAGLNERAVSFTKGCYVGQETVARLYYKGKPNRHLRGLRLSAPAHTGERLLHDGRAVGSVGSAVCSPRLGPVALALVRREAGAGATVSVGEGGTTAEILELPFAGGARA